MLTVGQEYVIEVRDTNSGDSYYEHYTILAGDPALNLSVVELALRVGKISVDETFNVVRVSPVKPVQSDDAGPGQTIIIP